MKSIPLGEHVRILNYQNSKVNVFRFTQVHMYSEYFLTQQKKIFL